MTTINNDVDDRLTAACINSIVSDIHLDNLNAGWWTDINTGEPLERNRGEMLMLIVTEIAEAMEGVRKGIPDDHLRHRLMEEVELADAVIRIFDYCGGHGLDLGGAIVDKLNYNKHREDHKVSNRLKEGGKKV